VARTVASTIERPLRPVWTLECYYMKAIQIRRIIAFTDPSEHGRSAMWLRRVAMLIAMTFFLLFVSAGNIFAAPCDDFSGDYDSGCASGQHCNELVGSCLPGGTVGDGRKIEICHIPPGCPDNFRTIEVSACAYGAHIGHGDVPGECPECFLDKHCATGEFCSANGDCHSPDGSCDSDADCVNGQICNGNGQCVDPDGDCSTDADCVNGQVCNGNGQCVDPDGDCSTDADCVNGQVCNGNGQ
jgi:hypothetical protein